MLAWRASNEPDPAASALSIAGVSGCVTSHRKLQACIKPDPATNLEIPYHERTIKPCIEVGDTGIEPVTISLKGICLFSYSNGFQAILKWLCVEMYRCERASSSPVRTGAQTLLGGLLSEGIQELEIGEVE